MEGKPECLPVIPYIGDNYKKVNLAFHLLIFLPCPQNGRGEISSSFPEDN